MLGMSKGGGAGAGDVVVIRGVDSLVRVDLEGAQRTVRVAGPLGETVVEIRNCSARVVDSPCREKVCVKMGWVRAPGDWVACVPNGVVVQGQARAAVDAVTR